MADDAIEEIKQAAKPVRARARRAASQAKSAAVEAAVVAEDEIEDRVASLSDEVGALARQVEHYAADRYGDAWHLVEGVGHAGGRVARRARRQTVAAARVVRDDPLPFAVALGLLALLTALLVGRSQR